MLTRSRHTQAYKKLGELYSRWNGASRLLSPAVDLLPQLLILPIILFVVGLLDNIMAASVPLSQSFMPVFVAGILSCIFVIAVAVYALWTVLHGCRHPDTSPFQSTLSRSLAQSSAVMYGSRIYRLVESAILKSWRRLLLRTGIVSPPTPLRTSSGVLYYRDDYLRASKAQMKEHMPLLTPKQHEAFYRTLLQTDEDGVLDEAAAALSAIRESYRVKFWAYPYPKTPNSYEAQSLFHLLSAEASIRSNTTAAAFIASSPTFEVSLTRCYHDGGERSHRTDALLVLTTQYIMNSPNRVPCIQGRSHPYRRSTCTGSAEAVARRYGNSVVGSTMEKSVHNRAG